MSHNENTLFSNLGYTSKPFKHQRIFTLPKNLFQYSSFLYCRPFKIYKDALKKTNAINAAKINFSWSGDEYKKT